MGRDTVPGFGARLRELRAAAGLTLAELAGRAGIHWTTVTKLERDERAPTFRVALALADALGRPVTDLVPGAKRKRKA